MASYRTPLSRVRGLGSAKRGVGHFIGQRVSAAALVVLMLWGVYSALGLAKADFEATVGWLRAPWNAVLMTMLVGVGIFHMQLGMRTIIEDYIQRSATRIGLLVLSVFVCWIAAAVGILSILKVALGGVS
jgi:succinate dehydrogenase / fumarate reductase membrane anchor subunit